MESSKNNQNSRWRCFQRWRPEIRYCLALFPLESAPRTRTKKNKKLAWENVALSVNEVGADSRTVANCSRFTGRMDTGFAWKRKQVLYFAQIRSTRNHKFTLAVTGRVPTRLCSYVVRGLQSSVSAPDPPYYKTKQAHKYTLPDWSDCGHLLAIRPNPSSRSGVLPTCPYSPCRPDAARPPTLT